jgi:hypothetical protein
MRKYGKNALLQIIGKRGYMNHSQRIILLIAFVLVLGMVLFPPWIRVYNYPTDLAETMNVSPHMEQWAGYHVIFIGSSSGPYSILRIDSTRLSVQLLGALLLTGLLYASLSGRVPSLLSRR